MELSEKLKQLRADKKITQEKLAEILHVSRTTISSWETGRSYPDLQMIVEISDYFNVSMDNLFNPKSLNSYEFKQIAKRYFENDKVSIEEKYETLKQIDRKSVV